MKRLNKFLSPLPPIPDQDKDYLVYQIRGKNGKLRTIEEPIESLKQIQAQLVPFFSQWPFHTACKARKGFGIAENAAPHKEARHLLRVDVKSCYPSITKELLIEAIESSAFNPEIKIDFISALDYCLFSTAEDTVLPTGAPTSPVLCNIALTPIDQEISALAEKHGYKYTRYIDDMHLSTTVRDREWSLLDRIKTILSNHGLKANHKKTRWISPSVDKAIITGVRIGKADRVPREFKRILRAKLNNLAMEHQDIDAETRGCLAYVQSIDKNAHQKFLAYYQRRRDHVPQK